MMKTIIFNDRCAYWSKNYMYNKSFIEQQIRYIYDLIRCQGYIYLTKVYALFGAEWDPHEPDNVIILDERVPVISYKFLGDDSFKISILY